MMFDPATGVVSEPRAFFYEAIAPRANPAPPPEGIVELLARTGGDAFVLVDVGAWGIHAGQHYLDQVADVFAAAVHAGYASLPAISIESIRRELVERRCAAGELRLAGRFRMRLMRSDAGQCRGLKPTHFFRGLPG